MPIVDYERVFETSKKKFFSDSSISSVNKEYVRKFLDKYAVEGVRASRKSIFLRHVAYVLLLSDDIKQDMKDRELVNSYFAQIRAMRTRTGSVISCATYQTIINCTNVFVKWLNRGRKPRGFEDIKNNKRMKRDLQPSDMINWQDVESMIGSTSDVQLQAIVAVQTEGGLRPSEFTDLNYGDISFNGHGIAKVQVNGTKTSMSRRTRHLYRATPYLQKWLRCHPVQQDTAPLWVSSLHYGKESVRRYKYAAMASRVKDLGKKAGIAKPLDFYNMRHSAVVLSKTVGLADSIAMREFGHTTTRMYSEVYGRLSDEDQRRAIEKAYGIESQEEIVVKTVTCQVCKTANEPNTDYCQHCNHPLSVKAIEKMREEQRVKDVRMEELTQAIKKQIVQELLLDLKGNFSE